ncbi:hypothetical protein D3C77_551490 [compost metagenome]
MHTKTLVRQMSFKFSDQMLHIFIIKAAVRVYNVYNIHDTLFNHFERFQQLVLHHIGQSHNVNSGFITAVMEYLH